MAEAIPHSPGKRPIAGLAYDHLQPGTPPTGRPELTWIAPGELLVDETYQRDLSDASRRLIRRIVEHWDWRRFKPPVTAWTDAGLEVIDGQHSAIAAATHPDIGLIPVIVVEAAQQADRAEAFIGHNRDRIAITAAQIHVAAAAAGDPDAIKVNRICAEAGVELLRLPPARGVYRPGQTIAVVAVAWIVASEDDTDALYVLRTLADARIGPITAAHIRAVHHLITADDFAGLDREALAATIQANATQAALQEAKEHATTHSVPLYRGIASVWFRAMKKRPPRSATTSPEASSRGAGASRAPPGAVRAAPLGRVGPGHGGPQTGAQLGDDIKNDDRPGRGKWKPGHYVRRCHQCDERFRGDGQALTCADCAYPAGATS